MMIDVQLLGYLVKYSPTGQETFKLELDRGANVGHLLEKIGMPPEIENRVVVNGRHAGPSTSLTEGDKVFIFAPAAGG